MKTKERSNWPDGSTCSIGKRYNEERLLGISKKGECMELLIEVEDGERLIAAFEKQRKLINLLDKKHGLIEEAIEAIDVLTEIKGALGLMK